MMLRRTCVATVLILLGVLSGLYNKSPGEFVETFEAAQVRVQAFSQSLAQTFREKNSTEAQLKLQALGKSLAHTFGEHSAVAQVKVQALGKTLAEHSAVAQVKLAEHSKAAQVKLQAAKESMAEHSTAAQVKLQAAKESMAHMAHEHIISREELSKLGSKLVVSSSHAANVFSERMQQLKTWTHSDHPAVLAKQLQESAISASRTFIERMPADAAALKAWCRTTVQKATPVQLGQYAVGIVLLTLFVVTLARRIGDLCCHRRQALPIVPSGQAADLAGADMKSHILMSASPLRHSHPPTPLHRRRRSDSPAPVAEKSYDPAAEQDLLLRLNAATTDELRSMSGIGDKTADRILNYRERQGGLESVGELVTKVGIQPGVFAKLAKAQGL